MGHHQATRDGRRVEGKTEGGVMCRGGCKVLLLPLDNRMLRRMPVRSYFCWLPHTSQALLGEEPGLGLPEKLW